MGTPLLELRDVSREYRARRGFFDPRHRTVQAVDGVDIRIHSGEILGLVGESGCGKSTVARLALGLEAPSRGRVSYRGRDLKEITKKDARVFRREVQMVFQDPFSSLNPKKTVFQTVREPLRIHGLCSQVEERERVKGLLAEVGIDGKALDRYPHEFSGGQRQRIGLARALATCPALVVADEPTSALDVSIQAQIVNLFLDLHERHRLSYLFISHDLPLVRFVSHRVGVMYQGRIVEVFPTGDSCPSKSSAEVHHPYTRFLFDAVPVPDPSRRGRPAIKVREYLPAAKEDREPNRGIGCPFAPRCDKKGDVCLVEIPRPVMIGPDHVIACHFPFK